MIVSTFNHKHRYRIVIYLRMSSDKQNERSPDQQLAEIKRMLKTLRLNWIIVKIYRDDAKTGRRQHNRTDFQLMLRELKTGIVQADLILVDTIERFGRMEELGDIRRQLRNECGVLILTADSQFNDPDSTSGRALSLVETYRATEDGKLKAHNVLRGKRDTALQKHWPGGPAPFGYQLHTVLKSVDGRQEVDYSVPVPHPDTAWIIKLIFAKSAETGWRGTRLANYCNEHPDIPDRHKPFEPCTVAGWLTNTIYRGDLEFGRNATDIVNDRRVIKRNTNPDAITYVPEFCEPLVTRELWDRVNPRRRSLADLGNDQSPDGKLIQPLAPGMVLTYPLSGLLYCATCKLRMTCSGSTPYRTANGEVHHYAGYVCTKSSCQNRIRVPEEWVREQVVKLLRDRLFPAT